MNAHGGGANANDVPREMDNGSPGSAAAPSIFRTYLLTRALGSIYSNG